MSENDTPTYELTDVQVDTLGLVHRGANREEFFLLKGDNATDAAPNTPEMQTSHESEVEAKVTKTVWQKLIELFKEGLVDKTVDGDTDTTVEKVMPSANDAHPMMGHAMEDDEDKAKEDEEDKEDEDMKMDMKMTSKSATSTTETPTIEPHVTAVTEPLIIKEAPAMADEVNVSISKADYDSLLVRLAKTEDELQKANDEKERATYIAKAQNYGYIPVATPELAEQLHWLAKTDGRRAQWWEDVLKAMDNMVNDSAMFREVGTVQMPTTALDGVMKSNDPKASVLALPKAEAEAYLRQVRRQK